MAEWKALPFSANRRVIYDLLTRARANHAPVSGTLELDVTDTLARIAAERAAGREVSLIAYLVRATALVVRAHPKLRQHLFTTWWGAPRPVSFDRISCTLIVAREGRGGEEVLLPLLLRDVDTLDVEAIHRTIREHKQRPVGELPQFRSMEKVKSTPGLALRWFDHKARTDPDFYLKYFGTYGLSSLLEEDGPVSAIATVANTASAFLPVTLKKRPWVVDGAIVPRDILTVAAVVDHYLIDGGDTIRMQRTLRELVEQPDRVLGPA